MKLVINTCYGAFGINSSIAEKYGFDDDFDENFESRTNEKLIALIERGVNCNDDHSRLKVANIPDEATDYKIMDQDGAEQVIYVIDGKIRFL